MITVTSARGAEPAIDTVGIGRSTSVARLRDTVAELRLRLQAARSDPERRAEVGYGRGKVVRIFDPTIRPAKSLSAERDVVRRHDDILKILREMGPFRLVGALAGPELAEKLEHLLNTHPNFREATEFLLQEEALARRRGTGICGVKLLLHGTPGVGKTDYALRVAEVLGLPFQVIGMSSAQASAWLAGSEEYWGNTQPGHVWQSLMLGLSGGQGVANALFVLDEIEKVNRGAGDPLGALYQLLEDTSACVFADKSVPWLPVDASNLNWFATANDVSTLHPAIISRFVLVEPEPLSTDQLRAIAQRIYGQMLDEFGLTDELEESLDEDALDRLVRGSVKDIKRTLRQSIAMALRESEHRVRIPAPRNVSRQRPVGFIS